MVDSADSFVRMQLQIYCIVQTALQAHWQRRSACSMGCSLKFAPCCQSVSVCQGFGVRCKPWAGFHQHKGLALNPLTSSCVNAGCSLIFSLSTSFLPGLFVRGGCCSPSARAVHHLGKEPAELDPLRLLQSNTQPEEQAAEGANKSGRPSKQEQPYSATRVSTLAAQWEQAQAGRQVAAGPPAGGHLFELCWSGGRSSALCGTGTARPASD